MDEDSTLLDHRALVEVREDTKWDVIIAAIKELSRGGAKNVELIDKLEKQVEVREDTKWDVIIAAIKELSHSGASNIELIDKLEKGTSLEKMAAARVLGFRKMGTTVLALVDALEQNKNNLEVALEIVGALRNFHSSEAVYGLFHRLFDGTDELVQADCRVAISEKGKSAFERMEIEQHTVQFNNLMEQHGVGIKTVREEIQRIKDIARSRQEIKEQESRERRSKEETLVRERQTREEVKHMERQVSHQHAIHQHKKKSHPQSPRNQNQHKPKNRI